MNETSKTLSIIAYYLSKYDLDAVTCLGYKNRSDAMKRLSIIFGRDNNYLKLRRDEFDVVTGSHRMGWRNRKPDGDVSQLTNYLNQFTFEQLSEIIIGLIIKILILT